MPNLSGGAWCSCCPRAYGRTTPDRPRHSCASRAIARVAVDADDEPDDEPDEKSEAEAADDDESAASAADEDDDAGSDEARS